MPPRPAQRLEPNFQRNPAAASAVLPLGAPGPSPRPYPQSEAKTSRARFWAISLTVVTLLAAAGAGAYLAMEAGWLANAGAVTSVDAPIVQSAVAASPPLPAGESASGTPTVGGTPSAAPGEAPALPGPLPETAIPESRVVPVTNAGDSVTSQAVGPVAGRGVKPDLPKPKASAPTAPRIAAAASPAAGRPSGFLVAPPERQAEPRQGQSTNAATAPDQADPGPPIDASQLPPLTEPVAPPADNDN